jgi:head-tail adaptor
MNAFIDIVSVGRVKDADGFAADADVVLASVRAYREDRNGNERWANRAAFSDATVLFRFRRIPELTVTASHFIVCDGKRHNIASAEDVRGRGMYVECLCELTEGSAG